jgi:nicotinamidase/pyrazinamidase
MCRVAHGHGAVCGLYAPAVASDGSFSYGPRAALLVVDIQNDFADPSGSLSVPGGEAVVAVANAEIDAARQAGAKVAYSQDWHPPETPHFAAQGGVWPVHCVRGTWGAAFHPDLVVAGEVIRKGTGGEDGYSAFSVRDPLTGAERPTRLAVVLAVLGVEELAVVGLATDYCVLESVLDAARLGLRPVVLSAGVRPVDLEPGDGERALEAMEAAGASIR